MVSSIGIPIIMDKITTSICEKPYGRASFARVLVEIDSSKKPVDSIELWYESLGKVLRLGVEYTWVPPRCDECKIFGHFTSDCARKINTVKAVDKNGDNVKATEVNKFKNSENGAINGGANEGWQMVGVYVNKANNNVGNVGAKDTSSKTVPVKSANVGKLDETIVINENSESAKKGKGKSNESDVGINGNRNMRSDEHKKDMGQKNPGLKNDRVSTKGYKNATGSKNGEGNNLNVVLGTKNVVTSNRFDLLSKEGISEEVDLWKVVKEQVLKACNTNVPIEENILKGWNTDMVKFYTLKWKSRTRNRISTRQQFETEMLSLSKQIVHLNRNIALNAKLNAEILLKNSDSSSGWYYSRLVILIVSWASYFCLSTGFWCCNCVFDRGDAVSDHDSVLWNGPCSTGVNKISGKHFTLLLGYNLCLTTILSTSGILGNLLCTAEAEVASCAGHWFVVLILIGVRFIVCNLLCTTEVRVASCAGRCFVVLEIRRLCTTGTDPNFCAGILYWSLKNIGQSFGDRGMGYEAVAFYGILKSVEGPCSSD
ncbi:zinc knuckle CX2CX4HX4C [Artemisia annua]|uniref:Zinc knuckle CX2CX4HX4C n=1 Tax=Artemisia annua TaxID=35608 RepID=A0A2U1MGE2_ARTAN|nr:zinc knuckle CX2CX4HX4C [Artemisia annua]